MLVITSGLTPTFGDMPSTQSHPAPRRMRRAPVRLAAARCKHPGQLKLPISSARPARAASSERAKLPSIHARAHALACAGHDTAAIAAELGVGETRVEIVLDQVAQLADRGPGPGAATELARGEIPNAALRKAFMRAHAADPALTVHAIARAVEVDPSNLRRKLGLKKTAGQIKNGVLYAPRLREGIDRRTAAKVAGVLGLDPVEVGL